MPTVGLTLPSTGPSTLQLVLAPDSVRADLTAETAARIAGDLAEAAARTAADSAIIQAGTGAVVDLGECPIAMPGVSPDRKLNGLLPPLANTISVREDRFGAVGNGVADDTAAIQAAVDYAITNDVKTVYFPPGSYKISAPIIVAKKNGAGSAWDYVATNLVGDGRKVLGGDTVTVTQTDPDQAAFIFQKWMGTLDGIAFYGQATHIETMTLADVLSPTTDWWGVCSHRAFSPHAAVMVDPFLATIPGAQQYPGQALNYVGASGGSSHYTIRNCYARDFIVAYMLSPSNNVFNGEVVNFDFNLSWCCHTSIAVGGSQALSIFVRNHEAWVNHYQAISCDGWGSGIGAFPRVEGLNVAGGCYQLFSYSATWANKSGIEVKGLHAESVFSLGNCEGMTFTEPTVHFVNYGTVGVRAAPTQGNVTNAKFIGGEIGQYIGTDSGITLGGANTAQFVGTYLEGPVAFVMNPPDGETAPDMASFLGVKYLYDESQTPFSSAQNYRGSFVQVPQGMRFANGQTWTNQPGGVGLSGYRYRATGPRMRCITLGNKVISNPERASVAANLLSSANPVVTLADVALLSVGDQINVRWFSPPVGFITAIDYGTGDITADIYDNSLSTSDPYNIYFRHADGSTIVGFPTAVYDPAHPDPSGAVTAGQLNQIALTISPMRLSFVHTNATRYLRVGDYVYAYLHGGAGDFKGLAGKVSSFNGDTVYLEHQSSGPLNGYTYEMFIYHEPRCRARLIVTTTSASQDLAIVSTNATSAAAFPVGCRLFGSGIPVGAYVTSVAGWPASIAISAPATANATVWVSDAAFVEDLEGTGIPTSNIFSLGSFVKNTAPAEAGTAGSKYIITGWVKVTEAAANILNTDWLPLRALTGN
jgi:hypothetical protein